MNNEELKWIDCVKKFFELHSELKAEDAERVANEVEQAVKKYVKDDKK